MGAKEITKKEEDRKTIRQTDKQAKQYTTLTRKSKRGIKP